MKTLLLLFIQILFSWAAFSEINVNYKGKQVEIEWSTSNNAKIDYFIIERSKKGKYFKAIMKIKSGEPNTNYYEVDYHPPKKTSFYRIKQVQADGSFTYSETILVKKYTNAKYKHLKDYKQNDVLLVLKDKNGNEFYTKASVSENHKQLFAVANNPTLKPAFYTIISSSDDILLNKKIKIINDDEMVDAW